MGNLLPSFILALGICLLGSWYVDTASKIEQQAAKIEYYELSLAEISNDMAINHRLCTNAFSALKSYETPRKRRGGKK